MFVKSNSVIHQISLKKMNDSCIHETNCILLEGDSEALFFGGKVDLLIHPGKQKRETEC